ncbi:MAG: endo-1,4-beta-xylanase, partial [Lachnospiraceae bacterium]|nr:endo-1,4-beta-xylanase [Lachnospiraceae bacterium]
DKRQEWYIKTVLEHFTGPESEYKDLFYGWDVLNEAISDNRGTYRNDKEGSSWWAVYQSNEFIISAFRYANKYAPASVKLYYNDYNDCTSAKIKGIEELLTAVKEAPGTRVDGMGMQGHYDIKYPPIQAVKQAAARYCAIVDEVMITELDFKASSLYDGTKDTLGCEYMRQAVRYRDIYDAMKELNESGEANVTGLIVWGVIDGNSWLQAYTGVGGGVTDGRPQCPLLFDDDYEPKPAFYGITDPDKLEVLIAENKKAVDEAKAARKAEAEAAKAAEEAAEAEAAEAEAAALEDAEKAPNVPVAYDLSRGHIAGLVALVILIALTAVFIKRP